MMRFRKLAPMLLCSAALISAAAQISGCSGKSVDENDPASLMKQAEDDIQSDHYQVAIDRLRAIKNKFPYSKFAIDAQLRIADVYFLQDSYAESAAAYEAFRDLHPKNEKVAYAMYRIGKSYYKDMPSTVARDMASAEKALDAYNEFLRRFPSAKEADDARKDVQEIRTKLAEKELYIGDFYLKRDQYDSAKHRYEKVLALYPETSVAKRAQKKLDQIARHDASHPEKK